MYVVRAKQSRAVIHMAQSAAGEELAPHAVYPEFDPETMEFGRSDEPAIPAWFTIENGIVKAEDPPEERGDAAPKPVTTLEEVKSSAIAYFSDRAFELRRALVPDYKLQNAALGVYDESETATIRDTVKAFRDEFYRLKGAIEKARSLKALKDVTPNFPTGVAGADPTPVAEPPRIAEPLRIPEPQVVTERPVAAERPVIVDPSRTRRERPRRPNT